MHRRELAPLLRAGGEHEQPRRRVAVGGEATRDIDVVPDRGGRGMIDRNRQRGTGAPGDSVEHEDGRATVALRVVATDDVQPRARARGRRFLDGERQ